MNTSITGRENAGDGVSISRNCHSDERRADLAINAFGLGSFRRFVG